MTSQRTLPVALLFAFALPLLAEVASSQTNAQAIPSSAQDVHPLLIGATVPDSHLKTADGHAFALRQQTTAKPTIIVFYRGGWCPYCTRHLAGLQAIESKLLDMGYQILAISPDHPTKLAQSQNETKLSYTLLSDHSLSAAQAFGIAFQAGDRMLRKLTRYNADIEAPAEESLRQLPVPAVFIVGKDGKIGFAYVNPDYKVRLDADVLLAAAQAVLKQ